MRGGGNVLGLRGSKPAFASTSNPISLSLCDSSIPPHRGQAPMTALTPHHQTLINAASPIPTVCIWAAVRFIQSSQKIGLPDAT